MNDVFRQEVIAARRETDLGEVVIAQAGVSKPLVFCFATLLVLAFATLLLIPFPRTTSLFGHVGTLNEWPSRKQVKITFYPPASDSIKPVRGQRLILRSERSGAAPVQAAGYIESVAPSDNGSTGPSAIVRIEPDFEPVSAQLADMNVSAELVTESVRVLSSLFETSYPFSDGSSR